MRCFKRRYSTPADAMLALIRIQRQRDIDNLDKHERAWYKCEHCSHFHLTSWTTTEGP